MLGSESTIDVGSLALFDLLFVLLLVVALMASGLCHCIEAVLLTLRFGLVLFLSESLLGVLGPSLVWSFVTSSGEWRKKKGCPLVS